MKYTVEIDYKAFDFDDDSLAALGFAEMAAESSTKDTTVKIIIEKGGAENE